MPIRIGTAVAVALLALFAGFLVFFALRDNSAIGRCHTRGGVTWDSGAHCVLGHPVVVSTR